MYDCRTIYPQKRYLQFRDVVIGAYDMIQDADLSGGFKTTTQAFSFGHGSYTNAKQIQQYSTEQKLALTLKINYSMFSMDQKQFYKEFLYSELSKIGKLWAIENRRIIWTYAFVESFSEPYSIEKNTFSVDLNFILYEGIWHYADEKKTFLKPYDACSFADCLEFEEIDTCQDDIYGCCISCQKNNIKHKDCQKCSCECDFLTKEDSLCVKQKDIEKDYWKYCSGGYQIIYNCNKGRHLWGYNKMLGTKICKKELCNNYVAGKFYSNTVLETDVFTMTIIGRVEDPVIHLNGNAMRLKGIYDGELLIESNGDVFYREDDCCDFDKLPIENLELMNCNTFGWSIKHGYNSLLVETNDCREPVCVFIKEDKITY